MSPRPTYADSYAACISEAQRAEASAELEAPESQARAAKLHHAECLRAAAKCVERDRDARGKADG